MDIMNSKTLRILELSVTPETVKISFHKNIGLYSTQSHPITKVFIDIIQVEFIQKS